MKAIERQIAVGENPKAADSLGVNVVRMRYVTAIVGAMLMGIAGAYLPMVYTGTFTEGMVQGRASRVQCETDPTLVNPCSLW